MDSISNAATRSWVGLSVPQTALPTAVERPPTPDLG
jgi:hypothetical protein